MYNPKIWYTGDIVTSGGLNNMEQGIAQNAHDIETINDSIEDLSADATELKDTLSDVKDDLMVMDDAVVYDYTKDTSVNHTSIPTQSTEVNWESVVITCEEGDQFYVKGKGGNSTLLWMFGDSNGAYILDYSATQQLLATDYIKIIAPHNAHYLCANNKYTEAKGGVIKASSTRINSVKKELLYTENAYDTVDYIFQYGFTVGTLTNTGSVNRSDKWKTTPFIPVAERKKYKVSSSQTGFTVLRAAYDSSKTLVAFAAFTMDTLERDWNIPANVSYVKFSIHNEINDFSFRLWDSKIEALESYVGEPIFVKLEQGTFGASGEDVASTTMTRSPVITLDGTIKVCVNKGYRLYIIPDSDYTKTDYAITDNATITVNNYKCRIKCAKLFGDTLVTPDEANANIAFIRDTPVINLSDERIQPIMVSAYNVGHFSHGKSSNPDGTSTTLQQFRADISNLKSDIILLSENDPYFDANSEMEIYESLYNIFPYYRSGDKHGYGCLGILSKWEIVEVKQIAFTSGTVLGTYIYDVTININNRIVHFLPVHLDHWSITLRRNQIQELIDYCADYEYCIIGGDMNPENKVDGQVPSGETPHGVWQEDWALFKNAGYVMANSDYFGDKTTYPGNSWPDGLAPQDNIFVKGTTGKIDYVDVPTFDSSDHYPITAHITLY